MNKVTDKYTIPEIAPELQRGPKWLRDRRIAACERFNNSPLPRRGLHLWRYTDPNQFLVNRSEVTDSNFGDEYCAVAEKLHKLFNEELLSAVVTDLGGRDINIEQHESLRTDGVIVESLSDAAENHSELLEKHLYSLVNAATGKFEAMNGALWNDGIFIYVPTGKTVARPIHLLRHSGMANSVQFPRLLVVVGKNAELTLIDEYTGGAPDISGGLTHCNSAVEIYGQNDSRTRYVMVQHQQEGVHSYLTHRASIAQNASMLTIPLAFGASLSKTNFGVKLDSPGAESNIYGLLFGSGRQQFDNHTKQHHQSGDTRSDIDFKVVLRDKANSAYTGLIRIENDAKNCEAYQENRNLLLNRGTKAEAIPELEILNEDVSCSHGATMGPIDPMSIFFLQSRGIERSEAVRIIVSGFVTSTLKQLPEDLRQQVTDFVSQRLEQL